MKVIPQRIQRKRSKGWKLPENTVCVTRPSKWGNPFVIGMSGEVESAQEAVALFEKHYNDEPFKRSVRKHLKGKNLACWCKIDSPCHADVLLKIANS